MVFDADAALRASRDGEGPRNAAIPRAHHRLPQWRRVRRQERPVQPRDGRRKAFDENAAAGESYADARGGLLLPSRPASREDVGEDRYQERRLDHRHALPFVSRRRRLWQLRCGESLLHGCASDRYLQNSTLQVRRLACVHQQAALRPQARPRYGAAALRDRVPSRQARGGDPEEPARHPARESGRAVLDHREPAQAPHGRIERMPRARRRTIRLPQKAR